MVDTTIINLQKHIIDKKEKNRIIIVDTGRYAINTNDLWIYFSKSPHIIVEFLVSEFSVKRHGFWKQQSIIQPARNNIYKPVDCELKIWKTIDGLISHIQKLKYDYICLLYTSDAARRRG